MIQDKNKHNTQKHKAQNSTQNDKVKKLDQVLSTNKNIELKQSTDKLNKSSKKISITQSQNSAIIRQLPNSNNNKRPKQDNTKKFNNNKVINKDNKNNKNTNINKNDNKIQTNNQINNKTQTKNKKQTSSIKVTFLGGLNEIGKNITLFEYGNDAFLLDCGMAFPDDEMMGIDLVIPDFTYVEKNKDKIRGIILTHGHEDHIGGLPFLFKGCTFPIYGGPLTLGLVGSKLSEHNLLKKNDLHVVKPGDKIKMGCMEIEMIHVNHSIPDAMGVAIKSPAGTIIHTGDFKIDYTPVKGEVTDLTKFAKLGNEGVLALFADSTNAENSGFTETERNVESTLKMLFERSVNKRIIVASFASNINRIQQIIRCAEETQRKVAFSGRSMLNYMTIASELGYLDVSDGVIIPLERINQYPKEKIVLVTTGSQGEPMSALARMAISDHPTVSVGPSDVIIISARPIPGNEKTVGAVVNELMKRGCEVIYESMYEVHVSGHACQGELKLLLSLVKPQYFIPVHGEQKQLRKQQTMGIEMGIKKENIIIADNGMVIEINKDSIKKLPPVQAGCVFVDGIGVGDVGSIVLKDRKALGENGLLIVVLVMQRGSGILISGPDIVSRGFVYVRESEQLMNDAKKLVIKVINNINEEYLKDWTMIKTSIRNGLSKLFYSKTKRSPMILPIIMEI